MKRLPLILSAVFFVLLCASTSFWVLQFLKPEVRKVAAPPVHKPVADVESVAGLFGGALTINTNYQLKGILLANPENQSGAILAVDGKPTQAYRMDAEIGPGVKLKEVHATYIMLQDNGVSKRIDLPQDSKSAGQIVGVIDNPSPNRGRNQGLPASGVNVNKSAARTPDAADNSILAGRNLKMPGMRVLPPEARKNSSNPPEIPDNAQGNNEPNVPTNAAPVGAQ